MIPIANVTAWRQAAPWPSDAQVEQDLALSRALVEIYSVPGLKGALAFRGGTALHKLALAGLARYSEDIDLVQVAAGPFGEAIDLIRGALDPWLGEPSRKRSDAGVTLTWRFETTAPPVQRMRLKVEVNTREHFTALGHVSVPFAVSNPWFTGAAKILTFRLEELLGTKLRALYQRRKGRDLFDLWLALNSAEVDDAAVAGCFQRYMVHGGTRVSGKEFSANLEAKLADAGFRGDIAPLLGTGVAYDPARAAATVAAGKARGRPAAGWGEDFFQVGGIAHAENMRHNLRMNSGEYSYIWQARDWPEWRYDLPALVGDLARVSRAQGLLFGRLADVGMDLRDQASLASL